MLDNLFHTNCFKIFPLESKGTVLWTSNSESIEAHINKIYIVKSNRISSIKLGQGITLLKSGREFPDSKFCKDTNYWD
jgi:hypothetical protein